MFTSNCLYLVYNQSHQNRPFCKLLIFTSVSPTKRPILKNDKMCSLLCIFSKSESTENRVRASEIGIVSDFDQNPFKEGVTVVTACPQSCPQCRASKTPD